MMMAVVQHEIIHSIGETHTHQRDDRDTYVTIEYQNMDPQWAYAFSISPGFSTYGTPYYGKSLMHYPYYVRLDFIIKNFLIIDNSTCPVFRFEKITIIIELNRSSQ